MNMQNLLNKLSALTTESLTMAGGSHAPAALAGLDEADEPLDEATMCEVCGNESCVCESDYSADEPLDEAGLTKNALYGQMKKTSNPSNYEPEISDEPIDTDDYDTDDYDTDHSEVDDNVSCWGCGQDWKENWSAEDLGPGEGYEEYGLDADDKICPDCAEELTGGKLNEAAMCEECGSNPCVCETDQLEEAKVKNYYAVATAAIKKKYDLGPGKVDLTDAQTTEAHKLAKKLKKDDKKLKESEQDGSVELAQLKRMMECWGPMAAPQTSGMNVTTNVDSKTGSKTVTVTADGAGAEELMKILAMAGIAVAPAPVATVAVGEQVANEPDPQTLDAQTQLVDMSGGPNAPHGQYNPDRARDNSMTFVDESVDRLASNLRAKFIRESQGSGSEKIKEDRMPVWKRDALIMVTKTKYPKLYAAIKGVNNGTAKGPFSAYYVDDPTPPSNETEFKNNLDKLQQRLDKLEKIIGTDEESKSKELKNFLASFKYEERPKMDHSKYVDPSLDKYGYPRPGVFKGKLSPDHDRSKDPYTDPDGYPKSTPRGWKHASERSEEDDWLH